MTTLDSALNPFFPSGYLKVVGFLIPADETTQELIDWYENVHSRNATVLWPHLDLYQRNYILDVEQGAVPTYRVVTEFVWKSDDDKKAAADLFGTPAAEAMRNERFPSWMKPLDIPNTHGLVPVDSILLEAPVATKHSEAVRRRRIVLLDRSPNVPRKRFDIAARNYSMQIADAVGVSVNLDLCRQTAGWPTSRAVIYINDGVKRTLPTVDNEIMTITNVFQVQAGRSPL